MGKRLVAMMLIALATAAAAPHAYRVHRTPDITINAMAEDPRDPVLWLATEQGVHVFDGVRFRKDTAFPLPAARQIGFTRDGALWAAGRGGLARRRAGQTEWETVLRQDIATMTALADRVYGRGEKGFQIDQSGRIEEWDAEPRAEMLVDGRGRLNWVDGTYRWQRLEGSVAPVGDYMTAAEDRGGTRWLADDQRVVRLGARGEVVEQYKRPPLARIARMGALWVSPRTGEAWFAGHTLRNLTRGLEFRGPTAHGAFPVLNVMEDRRGRMWVSHRGLGLVEWREEAGWQRWAAEEFGNEQPLQVLAPGAVVTRRAMFRREGDRWREFASSGRGYSTVVQLPGNQYLAASMGSDAVLIDASGRVLDTVSRATYQGELFKFVRDGDGEIWASTGFSLLRRRRGEFAVQPLPGITSQPSPNSFLDLAVDAQGVLWLSWRDRILRRESGGGWQLVKEGLPLVKSLSVGPGGRLWVLTATRKLIEVKLTGETREIDSPAVFAGWLKEDSRGWLWVGASDGVYVSNGREMGSRDWLHLREANGLVAGQPPRQGFLEEPETGAVWIAGEEGVSRIEPREEWFAEGREASPLVRARPEGGWEVGSIAAAWWRQYPYSYRIQPGTARWQPVQRGEIGGFAEMPPGEYRLEVRAGAEGGPVAVTKGVVESAARRWLGWGGIALALSGLGFWWRHPWVSRARYWTRKWIFMRLSRPAGVREIVIRRTGEVLFGRYELMRPLSRGGFSTVFEARDLMKPGGQRLAVKVLKPLPGKESWSREHFAQEVAALRSVDHPGVVPIIDSWVTAEGEPCVAMPYLEGPTLRQRLEGGPLSVATAAGILRGLGAALDEIHRRGIVHRDLKPENVILEGDAERPVLIDFGAAGFAAANEELAVTTLLAGSIQYLAPERLTGHYSAASDTYSLGVIALEMVSGRRLSDIEYLPAEQGFTQALEEVLRPALDWRAGNSAALLRAAFDPNPRRRPGLAGQWAAELAAEFTAEFAG